MSRKESTGIVAVITRAAEKCLRPLAFVLLALAAAGGGRAAGAEQGSGDQAVLVSAAASLTDVMHTIGDAWMTSHPQTRVEFNFGATGALQSQIEHGAPVDVFAGAAPRNVHQLDEKGLLDPASIRVMCRNTLVLVVPRTASATLATTFTAVNDPAVKRIGIGDPKSVPAGQYAVELLKLMGLHERLTPKYVYAENVRQALAWAGTGEVDAAFVYRTDAMQTDKVRILADSDPAGPPRIEYAIALTKQGAAKPAAREFLDYVLGPSGRAAFEKAGFLGGEPNE